MPDTGAQRGQGQAGNCRYAVPRHVLIVHGDAEEGGFGVRRSEGAEGVAAKDRVEAVVRHCGGAEGLNSGSRDMHLRRREDSDAGGRHAKGHPAQPRAWMGFDGRRQRFFICIPGAC